MRLLIVAVLFGAALYAQTEQSQPQVPPSPKIWTFGAGQPARTFTVNPKKFSFLAPQPQACSIPLLPVKPPAGANPDPKMVIPLPENFDPKMVIKPGPVCDLHK